MHLTMVAAIVAGLVFTHWRMRDQTLEMAIARMPVAVLSGIWALMLFAIVISQGSGNAFIYFQF
jgi:alginate O-acetyltransferase complex protein AlgI